MFEEISIKYEDKTLLGHIFLCKKPRAWIIFAHGSGSSRMSERNNWVARELEKLGFSSVLFDLLTEEEDVVYANRFNIPLLSDRLKRATHWLLNSSYYKKEPIGFFGASTGAAAALAAAADSTLPIYSVISRGGRPDLAGASNLNNVFAPTLLIVGSNDLDVIKLNEYALAELPDAKIVLVPGATHLFEEAGALGEVLRLAGDWFLIHLQDKAYLQE
jgi:pimeloyl-ACP methyl ester carboxylesterase